MTTLSPYDSMSPVSRAAYRAQGAAATLAPLPRAVKDDALLAIADAAVKGGDEIDAKVKEATQAIARMLRT